MLDHHDGRAAVAEPVQQAVQRLPGRCVQRHPRLVQHEHRRVEGERPGVEAVEVLAMGDGRPYRGVDLPRRQPLGQRRC